MKPHVLFLHQWKSAGGLYGSDKVLLGFLKFAAASIDPIVSIESEGQFADAARAIPSEVIVRNLGVLRQKHMSAAGIIRCTAHTLSSAFWLARHIRAQNISLVCSNTVSVLAGALAAKLSRRPHLWLIHEILEGRARLLAPLVRQLSDRIVVISEASAQSVHRGKPVAVKKTELAYPGINVKDFDQASAAPLREKYALSKDLILIGMVGRIHYWKGQDYFLDALYELKRRGIANFRGLIIGSAYAGYEQLEGELRAKVKRLDLENEVLFCGHRSDIESVHKALDIVAAPSTLPDPFCLVVAEAMAAGRPVISTNWGGPKEIIEDGVSGVLIPPNDAAIFADRLEKLVRDPALRLRMGSAGRKRVEERFSRDEFHRRTWATMKSLL